MSYAASGAACCRQTLAAIGLLMKASPPNNWGQNHLSEFIELARDHTFQTIAGLNSEYQRLVQIDSLFKRVQENLDFTKEWFAGLFLLRAHSSFLSAAGVVLGGQLPETYMILRGCIENSLYGLYLSRHKEDAEIWLKRNESQQMKKMVKDQFKNTTLLSFLKTIEPSLGDVADSLYERTIDFGAHPNQLALTTALRMEEKDSRTLLKIAYISGDPLATQLCLKTTAQVGVLALSVFRNVFKERFDLLGITVELEKLKPSL